MRGVEGGLALRMKWAGPPPLRATLLLAGAPVPAGQELAMGKTDRDLLRHPLSLAGAALATISGVLLRA